MAAYFGSLGIALSLLGTFLMLDSSGASVLWSALALAALSPRSASLRRLLLPPHAVIYALAAVWLSGLVRASVDALFSPAGRGAARLSCPGARRAGVRNPRFRLAPSAPARRRRSPSRRACRFRSPRVPRGVRRRRGRAAASCRDAGWGTEHQEPSPRSGRSFSPQRRWARARRAAEDGWPTCAGSRERSSSWAR